MKRSLFEQIILYDYRYLIGYGAMALIALYSLFWRLGSLLPGLSRYEADYINSFDGTLGSLGANPLFWPHKLLTIGSVNSLGDTALAFRLPGALLAMVGLAAFFLIVRHRFQARVAMVAVLLLATSSWWLASARLGRPEILIPVMMFLLVLVARLTVEGQSWRWLLILALLVGIAWYIPLLPYVILIGAAVSYSMIRKFAAEIDRHWVWLFYAIVIGLAIPLALAVINDAAVGRQLLALPEHWPSLGQLLTDVKRSLTGIFWSGPEFTPLNLGGLPLLDIFTSSMVILGVYFLDQEVSRGLTQFLLIGFLGLLVIMNLAPQPGHSVVLLPFVYTLVAAGIVMLFSQWYEIFPRNPVARMVAFVPTIFLVLTVVWYHHARYFVAWTNTPDIIETFPPLSPAVNRYLQQFGPDEPAVLLVAEDEIPLAQAASWSRPQVQVTTVGAAAVGQPRLAISARALESLDPETKKRLEVDLRASSSPYQSQPVVLWHTSDS